MAGDTGVLVRAPGVPGSRAGTDAGGRSAPGADLRTAAGTNLRTAVGVDPRSVTAEPTDVVCERRRRDGRTQFVLTHVHADLVPAVRAAWFTPVEAGWAKSFPDGTPHLDSAWRNFVRLVGPWLRQSAGLDPVPWAETLRVVADRLDGARVNWWLTGSAALAVRGAAVRPGDLDLVVAEADAHRVGALLLDGLVEPVAPADWFCRWWGRAMLGCRVEWVGGVGPAADEPQPSDFGLAAAATLETVWWSGRALRVPPLELQRRVSARRGLAERVAAIDALPLR